MLLAVFSHYGSFTMDECILDVMICMYYIWGKDVNWLQLPIVPVIGFEPKHPKVESARSANVTGTPQFATDRCNLRTCKAATDDEHMFWT